MFRAVYSVSRLARFTTVKPITPINFIPQRSFHFSPALLAKPKNKKSNNKKGSVKEEEEEKNTEEISIDFDAATDKFDDLIQKFNKSASEIKMGKTNPKIFDKLQVTIDAEEQPFTSLAQTSIKGRNFIITLFDPSNGKHIINSILGSDLNLSAQADPTNKYTLKVPLPSITSETKKESAKQLKEIFEKFKNGNTKSSPSLAIIRTEIRSKFEKQLKSHKKKDSELKELTKFDKLHKQYVDKLTESFKTAEAAILK
ncbi:ribosome recycling factor-domain-containing protein [Scheffersomyces coipomensis]|uniref:ribosome recycling factor-domain-containing protein n=1 Tax=Scheffersomyces coipomensis TaxID=1788519 RepID=UPI00315C574F